MFVFFDRNSGFVYGGGGGSVLLRQLYSGGVSLLRQQYNGFSFSGNKRRWFLFLHKRAKVFSEEVLGVYSTKFMKASRMLGDQLAIASFIKSHASFEPKTFSSHRPFLEDIGGASVLFLPCAVYNWTLPEGAGQFHGMPLDVKLMMPQSNMIILTDPASRLSLKKNRVTVYPIQGEIAHPFGHRLHQAQIKAQC